MRILHVDSGREMRGGQWQALYLAIELAARGHSAKLLCQGPLLKLAREKGLDAEPVSALAVLRESRAAELTHVHEAASHTLAAIASGSPVVVSRRVAFPPRTSGPSRWKYRRAVRFLAVSSFVRGILESNGIPPETIDVVYDGVPLPAKVVPYSDRDPRRIVCLATDDPLKESTLQDQIAASTGLTVHRSSALWDDLATASLFLYLTRSEGLGSAALLAMAHGVPVVASRVGGLPEIVEHGVTGLLTGNAIGEASMAIRAIVDDPSFAARLSAAGRARVERDFSTASTALATLASYRKVTGA